MTHSHNSEYTNSDNASIQNNLSHNYYEFEDKYYDGIKKNWIIILIIAKM